MNASGQWPQAPLRVLDLFSCIGGHALGLHAAGPFLTVAFCERDEWRRAVIAKNFPAVPIHDDVRTLSPATGFADVVIGGPPCQATSTAAAIHGRRTGDSLWPEMLRVVVLADPSWVVVEQPPGARVWEATVTSDLEAAGYGVLWRDLSAQSLGAPHLRRRRFAVAHADMSRLEVAGRAIARAVDGVSGRASSGNPWRSPYAGPVAMAPGLPTGLARRRAIEAIGDSNPPVMMTVIGRAILAAESAL